MLAKVSTGAGFIAALDQSGGSTPGALRRYGIEEDSYSGEEEMFDLVHQMRTRIITSPVFDGERILAAILFEQTMDREIDGLGSAEYLWQRKHIVPFLKVDKGLAEPADGVRLMKPVPGLDALLERALSHGVFGTKMRSLVLEADPAGIDAVVDQQFELAGRILDAGLVPIVEPEVDIHCPQKATAEELLERALLVHLDALAEDRSVVLKLTLPEADDGHRRLLAHPRVLRVAALSGGYSREEAVERLRRAEGVIASFSRALTEGLSAQMSQAEFDAALDASIEAIRAASAT
ncbi:fructose bisphosphate aldolase [Phycicoccus endophyticus]|uniref:fructose-bisphosphate aldolase n=2 Tax=Phycicoccus endophyticus TaxID=1690220 RepID=A0A7G9R5T1_9MICO|nr:fructose bisphosphate aldolase [Phycicoccus endophyticus]